MQVQIQIQANGVVLQAGQVVVQAGDGPAQVFVVGNGNLAVQAINVGPGGQGRFLFGAASYGPDGNAAPIDVDERLRDLKSESENVRRSACVALGRVRDARAVEPLIAALEDPNAGVQLFAAQALGVQQDRRATRPLVALLEGDRQEGVQVAAARCSVCWATRRRWSRS